MAQSIVAARSPSRPWRWGWLLLLPLAVGGVWLVRSRWGAAPADRLVVSGHIEGYEASLGARSGGRVEQVTVREGDTVVRGQVLVRLDDGELQAQQVAAQAAVQAAQQRLAQAESQVAVVQSQIAEAQWVLQQTQDDTAGRLSEAAEAVAVAEAQVAQAEAQVQQAQADQSLAALDRDRALELYQSGAIAQQALDQAQTRYSVAQEILTARQAARAAAERQVAAAQGRRTQVETSRLNPDIRTVQLTRLQRQLDQAIAAVLVAQADVDRAIAQEQEVAARLNHLVITSPLDGVVLTRLVEPGEVIGAGTPVLTVINLEEVYLRGYIAAGEVGRVRVGQAAAVFLDSDPDQPFAATVIAIDAEAAFTPENIYFREDRVTQVFGLRLGIENAEGFAKPGMPADGAIFLADGDES
jgi:HlyD family secretion protein